MTPLNAPSVLSLANSALRCVNGVARRHSLLQRRTIASSRRVFDAADDENKSGPTISAILPELKARGLVSSVTNEEGLNNALESGRITAYCGVDPTAASLHLGNLKTLMPLIHLFAKGHNIIPLIGGFTCQIGDPAGRTTDRETISATTAANNIHKITFQIRTLFERARKLVLSHGYSGDSLGQLTVLDNSHWWHAFSFGDFMHKVARNMRLGPMLARDSVKGRLNSAEGIDAASFLYQAVQAYDFYHIHHHNGCQLQIGGSDQWGNITAGIDLIDKLSPETKAFGLTVPLLLSPTGEKLGKSAGNALFLSSELTHPFNLYQYALRTTDEQAGQYLRIFTLLPLQRISQIVSEHSAKPEERFAQGVLAEELVSLVHGSQVAQRCISQTKALYPPRDSGYNVEAVIKAFQDDEQMFTKIGRDAFFGRSTARLLKDIEIVSSYGISPHFFIVGNPSKTVLGEGSRIIEKGGLYINGIQEKEDRKTDHESLLGDRIMVIRLGKSTFHIIEVIADDEEEAIADLHKNSLRK